MDSNKQLPRITEAMKTVCLLDVEAEAVDWFWKGYIPYGNITIIQGDPGVGKGAATMHLAACATTGRPLPNSAEAFAPINVLLLTTAEDDLARTIKPRLSAEGADCSRIFAFEDLLTLSNDMANIEEAVREHQARFVIVDPLNAYLGSDVDGHKDQDVRKVLSPIKMLAADTNAAIVLVHHMNKATGGKALYRGGGSIGIAGAARSVLLAAQDPGDPTRRILARVKGNLCGTPPTLLYRIETAPGYDVPRILWEGVSALSADEALAEPSHTTAQPNKQEQAEVFLMECLADGEKASVYVAQEARKQGVSDRTLDTARKKLNIASNKRGNVWFLHLPEERNADTDTGAVAFLHPCALDMEGIATIAGQDDAAYMEECKDARAQERNGLFVEDYGVMDEEDED